MALTLDQARKKLFKYVYPSLDTDIVTDRINSALERIYNSGKWKGLLANVSFSNPTDPNRWWLAPDVDYITLPRQFQSVLGVQFSASGAFGVPRQVYPRWQEFMASGAGQISSGGNMEMLIDSGDGFTTYIDPTVPFYPCFQISDPDDIGIILNYSAVDTNGNDIFDAEGNSSMRVTLTSSGVTLPTLVGKITEIQKPVTQGMIYLWAVNPNDSSQSAQIGEYEPTETIPSYKRYKASASQYAAVINTLCKRRYVELVNGPDDETVIIPGNEGALKLTLMALQYEDKNDMERAETYFNKAIQLLNAELKEDMGDPVITLQMNPLGAAMRIPARY